MAEGSLVTVTATGSDPASADVLTYAWDLDNDGSFETAGQTAVFSAAAIDGPASRTVAVRVSDDDGGTAIASATVTVDNAAPVIASVTGPADPVALGTTIGVSAGFADAGAADTHTALWSWGDGSSSAGAVGAGSVTGSHAYAVAGVYAVGLTVTDDDGGQGIGAYRYMVMFDPDTRFVAGGGTIASPAGAYAADPSLAGSANLGFYSTVQKGSTATAGDTAFHFSAAGLDFRSGGHESLVVSGARAQLRGTGAINGAAGFSFLVTAIDGDARGGGGVDRFRIKIWNTGGVVYDNEPGNADSDDPATALTSGSIIFKTTGKRTG